MPPPQAARTLKDWADAVRYLRSSVAELKVAESEVAAADARWRGALAAVLPQGVLQGFARRELISNETSQVASVDPSGNPTFESVKLPFPNTVYLSATISQQIVAPRAWANISAASHGATAAGESLFEVRRSLFLRLTSAILAVFTAERVVEIQRVATGTAMSAVELAQRRLTLGGGTAMDYTRVASDAETAKSGLLLANESLRQTREALGQALGVSGPVGVASTFKFDSLESSLGSQCHAVDAPHQRPDITAARELREQASSSVTAEGLALVPTVQAVSEAFGTSADTGAAPRLTWNLQAVLTIPIWDGGTVYSRLREARAGEVRATQRLGIITRAAEIEVAQTRRAVELTLATQALALRARDFALQTERLVRKAYAEGKGTGLDVSSATKDLRTAELTLALRDLEVVRARIANRLALTRCDSW